MRPGTPGFVAAQLVQARETRALTQTSLAELVGVTRQAMSRYERGESTPDPTVLERISSVLAVPRQRFIHQPGEAGPETFFFRSMAATTKTARLRAIGLGGWLEDVLSYVAEFVELPSVDVPDLGVPDDITRITNQDIENAAARLREHWRIKDGPIPNMCWVLENRGIVLSRMLLGDAKLDALSAWSPSQRRPFILLGAEKESASRSRFDAAHELGHLVLHRKVDARTLGSAAMWKRIEDQAHRFAGAFLLPYSTFTRDFTISLDAFRVMKSRWKVSIALMIKRASDLRLLSETAQTRMWMNYTRRGWRRWEPLDDSIEIERPRLLRGAFELVVGGGLRPRADVLASLALAGSDIENLASLPKGFFDESFGTVTELPVRVRTREPVTESSGEDAEILRFPSKKDHDDLPPS